MTRKEKFNHLENLCQQKYYIIDQAYQAITYAQWELEKLEKQYLKAKESLDKLKTKKKVSLAIDILIDKIMILDVTIKTREQALEQIRSFTNKEKS